MRLVLPILLAGCAVGDGLTDPSAADAPQPVEAQARFVPGASTPDPGFGVVPNPHVDLNDVPTVWASMGPVLCTIEGRHGQVDVDVDVSAPPGGVVVVDADTEGFLLAAGPRLWLTTPNGDFVDQVMPVGPVAAGERLSDGSLALLVDLDDGCALELDGVVTPLTSGACNPESDVEEAGTRVLISTAQGILDDQGAVFASGDQVSVDESGAIWTGLTGSSELQGHIGNSTISIDLPAGLVDFEVRQGKLVALTDAPSILRIDGRTGAIEDEEPYYGVLNRTHLQLSDDARTVSITGQGMIQFYRMRTDAQLTSP